MLVGDSLPALGLSQEHHAAVRGDPATIEGGAHLFPRNRWQVEGQRNILIHQRLPPLDRCAASGSGIMPHIRVSYYVRPTVRAHETVGGGGASSSDLTAGRGT